MGQHDRRRRQGPRLLHRRHRRAERDPGEDRHLHQARDLDGDLSTRPGSSRSTARLRPATGATTPTPPSRASSVPRTCRSSSATTTSSTPTTRYWQTNADDPLTGFSPIIGCEDCEQGLRTRLGHEMVAQRMDATDGLGGDARLHAEEHDEHVARRPQPRRGADQRRRSRASARTTRRSTASTSPRRARSSPTTTTPACSTRRAAGSSTSGGRTRAAARSGARPFDVNQPLTTPNTLNQSNAELDRGARRGRPGAARPGDPARRELRRRPVRARQERQADPDPRLHRPAAGRTIDSNFDPDDPTSYAYGQVGAGSSTVQMTELTPRQGAEGALAAHLLAVGEPRVSKHYSDQTEAVLATASSSRCSTRTRRSGATRSLKVTTAKGEVAGLTTVPPAPAGPGRTGTRLFHP